MVCVQNGSEGLIGGLQWHSHIPCKGVCHRIVHRVSAQAADGVIANAEDGKGYRGHVALGAIPRKRYRDWETDRKSTRLNSSHSAKSRMPSSA